MIRQYAEFGTRDAQSAAHYNSAGSDDDARYDQLELDFSVKLHGPVNRHVQPLSYRQWPLGSEAQTSTADVYCSTGAVCNCRTRVHDAVPKFQIQGKADLGAAL